MVNMIATGERIERAINAKNIKMYDLADEMGVSVQCVYQWKDGKRTPSLDNALILSRVLDTPFNELFVEFKED